ncbi:MAG: uncharacterized protein PWR13_726 [Archaeoglobi archaeon]|nr:uncharacterized protein [Archaeoglobi archaeon]MDK2781698.1 uncharacterized protein [Archaeoglobi archaeon]
MKLTPVYGKPALLLEGKERYIVIADLHVGIEREWMRRISRRILERLKEDISEILKRKECENLIILGDLKHTVEGATREDERVIRNFLEELSSLSDVIIVKGNHDGGIEEISPENIEIKDSRGFRIEEVALLHGHASPGEDVLNSEIILTAHIHPVISFRERSGLRIFERVWVRIKAEKEVLIMPAFNSICGGAEINDALRNFLILRDLRQSSEPEIYLLDGIKVGAGARDEL